MIPVREAMFPLRDGIFPVREAMFPLRDGIFPVREAMFPLREGMFPANTVEDIVVMSNTAQVIDLILVILILLVNDCCLLGTWLRLVCVSPLIPVGATKLSNYSGLCQRPCRELKIV